MQDLLANVAIDSDNVGKLSLVVDNARRQKERTEVRKSQPDRRSEQWRQKQLLNTQILKNALDISDHTKKDSRWVSTMAKQPEGGAVSITSRHDQGMKVKKNKLANKQLTLPQRAPRFFSTRTRKREQRSSHTLRRVGEVLDICSKTVLQ